MSFLSASASLNSGWVFTIHEAAWSVVAILPCPASAPKVSAVIVLVTEYNS